MFSEAELSYRRCLTMLKAWVKMWDYLNELRKDYPFITDVPRLVFNHNGYGVKMNVFHHEFVVNKMGDTESDLVDMQKMVGDYIARMASKHFKVKIDLLPYTEYDESKYKQYFDVIIRVCSDAILEKQSIKR